MVIDCIGRGWLLGVFMLVNRRDLDQTLYEALWTQQMGYVVHCCRYSLHVYSWSLLWSCAESTGGGIIQAVFFSKAVHRVTTYSRNENMLDESCIFKQHAYNAPVMLTITEILIGLMVKMGIVLHYSGLCGFPLVMCWVIDSCYLVDGNQ